MTNKFGYCSVVGYTLLLSLIEYKTLVMRGDLERANTVLPSIPKEQHNRCHPVKKLIVVGVTIHFRLRGLLLMIYSCLAVWHISSSHVACWRKPLI
jgi:hypothetical protein